jgi:hypothetical protein
MFGFHVLTLPVFAFTAVDVWDGHFRFEMCFFDFSLFVVDFFLPDIVFFTLLSFNIFKRHSKPHASDLTQCACQGYRGDVSHLLVPYACDGIDSIDSTRHPQSRSLVFGYGYICKFLLPC